MRNGSRAMTQRPSYGVDHSIRSLGNPKAPDPLSLVRRMKPVLETEEDYAPGADVNERGTDMADPDTLDLCRLYRSGHLEVGVRCKASARSTHRNGGRA